MPTKPKNKLTLEECEDNPGTFRLFGYIETEAQHWGLEKVRMQSTDYGKLELKKNQLEAAASAHSLMLKSSIQVAQTWLLPAQLRDAEAAVLKLPAGRTLAECVDAADLVLGTGEPVSCADALARWKANQESWKLSKPTIVSNVNRVKKFTKVSGAKMLGDIKASDIERWVLRPGTAPHTQAGDGRSLRAWLAFCVADKMLRRSPMELDMRKLRDRAKPVEEPEILTPEQCEKLLNASLVEDEGSMAPFVIVSLWCFMRKAEAMRLKPSDVIMHGQDFRFHIRGEKVGSKWREPEVPANVAPLLRRLIEDGAIAEKIVKDGKLEQAGGVYFSERIWKKVRARAGLIKLEKPKPNAGGLPTIQKGSSEWAPNILRHTGMSYLFQKTRDIKLVTMQAGDSPEVALKHYLRRAKPGDCDLFYAIKPGPQELATEEAVA